MALTVTDRGTGTHNTSATTFTLSPGSNCTAGATVLLCIAADNAGASGGAFSTFTVTDTLGNTWTRRISPLYDPGNASAGVEGAIFETRQTGGTLTTGTTITVTFNNATTAKAWTMHEITAAANKFAAYVTGGVNTGAATGTPTVTTGSITSGDAVIGAGFAENTNSWAGDADTTNGNWSTHQSNGVGSTTSAISITSQAKVVNATAAQTYNPTRTSSDCIIGWVQYRELNAYTLACDTTSYAYTGVAAGTLRGRLLAADAVTFAFTGQDANLARGRTLVAEATTYAYTGQDATLTRGRTMVADGATFAFTTFDAGVRAARLLTADATTFAFTAFDAGTVCARRVVADTASFAFTANDAGVLRGRRLVAEAASFAYTGQTANLSYSGGPQNYTLTAQATSYAYTANTTGLFAGRILALAGKAFAFTGPPATLRGIAAARQVTVNPPAGWALHLVTDVSQAALTTCIYYNVSPAVQVGDQVLYRTTTESNGWTASVNSTGIVSISGGSGSDTLKFHVWSAGTWSAEKTYNVTTSQNYTLTAESASFAFTGQAAGVGVTWRFEAAVTAAVTTSAVFDTTILLAAVSTGPATASADLTTSIRPAASVSAAVSVDAPLTTAIPLASAISATVAHDAAITTAITPAVAVTATVAGDAGLTTAITLASSVDTAVTTTADLLASAGLVASVTATATQSAALTTAIPLDGATSGAVTTSAALSTAIRPASSVTATVDQTAALTTAIPLAGALTAAVTTSAALSTAITNAATASGTVTTVAALTTAIPLAASASVDVTVAAPLVTSILAAGALMGPVTASASLTVGSVFEIAASATAAAAADLTTAITPAAAVSATASELAVLSTAIRPAGSATVSAAAQADLTAPSGFVAAATASAAQSAALTTAIAPAASVTTVVTTAAALSTAIRPAASVSASAASTGGLSTAIRFAGGLSATASVTFADLTAAASFACAVTGAASGAGDLTTAITPAASATASVTPAADLTTAITVAGTAATSAAASGGITTAITPAASATASAASAAALTTAITTAAAVTAAGAASAALSAPVGFAAAVSVGTSATSDLTTAIRLAVAGTAAVTVSAPLTTSLALAADRTAAVTTTAALSTAIRPAVAASATAASTAALTTGVALAAAVTATVTPVVDMAGTGAVASADVTVTSSAALTTVITFAAERTARVTSVATITVSSTMAASVAVGVTVSAPLSTSIRLVGALTDTVSATAGLTTALPLGGSLAVPAASSGALTTAVRLSGAISGAIVTASGAIQTQSYLAATASTTGVLTAWLGNVGGVDTTVRPDDSDLFRVPFAKRFLLVRDPATVPLPVEDTPLAARATARITIRTRPWLGSSGTLSAGYEPELCDCGDPMTQLYGFGFSEVYGNAALDTGITLAAAPAVVVGLVGNMNTGLGLIGDATVSTGITGTLGAAITFGAVAAVTVVVPPNGAQLAAFTGMAGTASAGVTVAADLTASVTLAAAVSAGATGSAALTAPAGFVAAVSASVTASGTATDAAPSDFAADDVYFAATMRHAQPVTAVGSLANLSAQSARQFTNYGTVAQDTTTHKFGSSRNFDAATKCLYNGSIGIETGYVYGSAQARSYDLWFRPTSLSNSVPNTLFAIRDSDFNFNSPGQIALQCYVDPAGKLTLVISSSVRIIGDSGGSWGVSLTGTTTITTGNWYYARMVFATDNTIKMYLWDGSTMSLEASGTGISDPGISVRNKVTIGGLGNLSVYPFNGRIEGFGIYNKAYIPTAAPTNIYEAPLYEKWDTLAGCAISNSDRTVTQSAAATETRAVARGRIPRTGKYYCEMEISDTSSMLIAAGIVTQTGKFAAARSNASTAFVSSGATSASQASFAAGRLMFAFDWPNKKMWVGRNGVWFASGDPDAGTNPYYSTLWEEDWYLFTHHDNDNNGVGTTVLHTSEANMQHYALSGFSPLVSSAYTDPSFSNVALLLHFDGANNSTTIVDRSNHGDTSGAVQGNAKISTAQLKYGSASLELDGTDDAVWFNNASRFNLGNGDFTIEFDVRFGTSGTQERIAGQGPSDGANSNSSWQIYRVSGTNLIKGEIYVGASTTYTCTSTTALSSGTWHKIALCRSGTNLRLFINGTLESTTAVGTDTVNSSTAKLSVGSFGEFISGAGRDPLQGHVDEFRMTVGTARYTATYTPLTAPFPNS